MFHSERECMDLTPIPFDQRAIFFILILHHNCRAWLTINMNICESKRKKKLHDEQNRFHSLHVLHCIENDIVSLRLLILTAAQMPLAFICHSMGAEPERGSQNSTSTIQQLKCTVNWCIHCTVYIANRSVSLETSIVCVFEWQLGSSATYKSYAKKNKMAFVHSLNNSERQKYSQRVKHIRTLCYHRAQDKECARTIHTPKGPKWPQTSIAAHSSAWFVVRKIFRTFSFRMLAMYTLPDCTHQSFTFICSAQKYRVKLSCKFDCNKRCICSRFQN